MNVLEEDVFQPAPEDVVQDWMLNWVIRGVTLNQSYKKEDYIPITPERFKGLQQFTYSAGAHPEAYPMDVFVYKLDGLEYATDLWKIDLSYNGVSDLTPLKDLQNLRDLTFYMNHLTDISPLSNLTNLENLNISFNKITDLRPLTNIKSLRSLNAENTGLTSLSGLENCTKMSYLNLNRNNINDISALKNMINMDRFLWLSGNSITDISALAGMTQLKELDLSGNQVSDISALKNLRNLQALNLNQNTEISDITPLVHLTNLDEKKVSFNGTKIETKKALLFEILEVHRLIEKFNANEISLVDKGKVEDARRAYDHLSAEAKSYVTELRIRAAEENIQRLEAGEQIIHYDELDKYTNMAQQDVKVLELRVTDENGKPMKHVRYNIKGQNLGNVYGEISTNQYGIAEFSVPANSNEATFTLELKEASKFTGNVNPVKVTILGNNIISQVNGAPVGNGKYDIVLTLKDGEVLETNKTLLEELVTTARKIKAEGYLADSYEKMIKALRVAEDVLEDATASQEKIDQAELKLRTAINNLKKGDDFRTFVITVQDANQKPLSGIHFFISNTWPGITELVSDEEGKIRYTVLGKDWNAYKLVISDKEDYVIGKEYTLDDGSIRIVEDQRKIVEINRKPVTKVEDLKFNIVLKSKTQGEPVNTIELQELIKKAEAYLEKDYTSDSFKNLQTVLENSRKLLENTAITQEDVNNQKDVLQKAIDSLVPKVERPQIDYKEELQKLYDEAKKLDKNAYTEDSWNVLQKAVEETEILLKDPNADPRAIRAQHKVMEEALKGLILKEETQEKPEQEKPQDDSQNNSQNESNGNDIPQLGDNASVGKYISLMICAMAVVVVLKKKVNLA